MISPAMTLLNPLKSGGSNRLIGPGIPLKGVCVVKQKDCSDRKLTEFVQILRIIFLDRSPNRYNQLMRRI
jgi:hypothetical protein